MDSDQAARAIREWLNEVAGGRWLWYAKRLSANDTLATGAHQAGPYLPRAIIRRAFPELANRQATDLNPDVWLALRVDSHADERDVRVVWYNNKVVTEGGTRNESRMTNLGGADSPLLNPEATGAIVVLAFDLEDGLDSRVCRAWLCSGPEEEEVVEDFLGTIEPGAGVIHLAEGTVAEALEEERPPCRVGAAEMPAAWRKGFPDAEDLVARSVERLVALRRVGVTADDRLVQRRDCEFELFQSLEEVHVLPRVTGGFPTVDAFVGFANTVTNRRKSRSGRSLELHAAVIFREDGLEYSRGEVSEGNKRPDFLFPSAAAYHDAKYPTNRLRMLAAKTTCKDRWRQILNEADRLRDRFLLTMQEGVSVGQWEEMKAHHVTLVVPRSLHRKYPAQVREHLVSLESFIGETIRVIGDKRA